MYHDEVNVLWKFWKIYEKIEKNLVLCNVIEQSRKMSYELIQLIVRGRAKRAKVKWIYIYVQKCLVERKTINTKTKRTQKKNK